MENAGINTEENIKKLLNSSLSEKDKLDQQLKNDMLQLLEQKVAQKSRSLQPDNKIIIMLSVIWIALSIFAFFELRFSIYLLDLVRSALALSLLLVPFSSIILVILKTKLYAKKMV